jgi:hypothetical protein
MQGTMLMFLHSDVFEAAEHGAGGACACGGSVDPGRAVRHLQEEEGRHAKEVLVNMLRVAVAG